MDEMIISSNRLLNKSKLILGIAITILGGFIILESMISGGFRFTEKLNEDFQVYSIELQASQAPLKTSFFSAEEDQLFSVWLRYSNRQMRNKNINIAVSIVDEDENIITEFREDLQFGPFRNGAKKIRYYKLGEYDFKKGFRGYIQYELAGTWPPSETSALVLRKSPPVRLPLKQIGFFVVGIFALIIGLETISKNCKNQGALKKDKDNGSTKTNKSV
jgi:hypothetical protein